MTALNEPDVEDAAALGAASTTDYSRLAAMQWGVQAVTHSGAAWQITQGSHDVVVGLVDTGIDFRHPDLLPNIMPGSRTFVPGTLTAADDGGHGTHVAGIVAANGYLKGVAPGVGIRAYKAVDGHGQASALWVARAIVAAADDGVDVINLSLGFVGIHGEWFYTDPDTGERIRLGNDTPELIAMQRAVRYAVRHGATVVAAAHNWSQDISKRAALTDWYNMQVDWGFAAVGAAVEAPCTMPGVLCVSAMGGGWGTPNRPAYYTNYGAAIDLTAPGGDLGPTFPPYTEPNYYKYLIISTVPTYPTPFFHGVTRYGYAAGTSMAAPHAAGVAALYIAQQLALTGSKPSPAQVTARLLQTAAPLGKNGVDPYFGQGLADAYSALTAR
jgi:subtilisin family serine protease